MITVFSLIKFPGLQCLLLDGRMISPRDQKGASLRDITSCYTPGVEMAARSLDISSLLSEEIMNRHGCGYFYKILLSFLHHRTRSAPLFSSGKEDISLHGLRRISPQALGHPEPTFNIFIFWLTSESHNPQGSQLQWSFAFQSEKDLSLDIVANFCHLCDTRQVIWTLGTSVSISETLVCIRMAIQSCIKPCILSYRSKLRDVQGHFVSI